MLEDTVTPEGKAARGLYFSYGYLQRFGAEGVARTLKGTKTNAAVLDVKDASGRVSHRTRVKALKPQIAERALDLRRMVRALRRRHVYTIARIACFADPSLSQREPERAIVDARHPGKPWASRGNGTWLDPYNRDNHRVIVALAREAEQLGFDEIQLDYVRFPVDRATEWASYPAQEERPRYQVLLELLRDVDEAVNLPLGVDVFGLAALNEGDPSGLGQSLSHWVEHVEVISPMLYVNGMRTWGRGSRHRAGMLIERITHTLRERVGDGPIIRPYIQAFAQGADHFGADFIREQIAGARDGEADGFLFWHPGSNYAMVKEGMRGMRRAELVFGHAEEGLAPFERRRVMDQKSQTSSAQDSAQNRDSELDDAELDAASGGTLTRLQQAQAVTSSVTKKLNDTTNGIASNLK